MQTAASASSSARAADSTSVVGQCHRRVERSGSAASPAARSPAPSARASSAIAASAVVNVFVAATDCSLPAAVTSACSTALGERRAGLVRERGGERAAARRELERGHDLGRLARLGDAQHERPGEVDGRAVRGVERGRRQARRERAARLEQVAGVDRDVVGGAARDQHDAVERAIADGRGQRGGRRGDLRERGRDRRRLLADLPPHVRAHGVTPICSSASLAAPDDGDARAAG